MSHHTDTTPGRQPDERLHFPENAAYAKSYLLLRWVPTRLLDGLFLCDLYNLDGIRSGRDRNDDWMRLPTEALARWGWERTVQYDRLKSLAEEGYVSVRTTNRRRWVRIDYARVQERMAALILQPPTKSKAGKRGHQPPSDPQECGHQPPSTEEDDPEVGGHQPPSTPELVATSHQVPPTTPSITEEAPKELVASSHQLGGYWPPSRAKLVASSHTGMNSSEGRGEGSETHATGSERTTSAPPGCSPPLSDLQKKSLDLWEPKPQAPPATPSGLRPGQNRKVRRVDASAASPPSRPKPVDPPTTPAKGPPAPKRATHPASPTGHSRNGKPGSNGKGGASAASRPSPTPPPKEGGPAPAGGGDDGLFGKEHCTPHPNKPTPLDYERAKRLRTAAREIRPRTHKRMYIPKGLEECAAHLRDLRLEECDRGGDHRVIDDVLSWYEDWHNRYDFTIASGQELHRHFGLLVHKMERD